MKTIGSYFNVLVARYAVFYRWITETFHLKWHVHYPIMEHNHRVPDAHDIAVRLGRV